MLRSILAAGLLATGLVSAAHAKTNIWFILDSSGSMAGKLGNDVKINVAKSTLRKLISDISTDTRVTLIAYGHRRKDDCGDIGALTGMMTGDRTRIVTAALDKLKPLGKTPIADALRTTGLMAARNHSDDTNTIVLISDGIETCQGDPCRVAGELARHNVSVRTHVVGFGVSAQDQKQLECIARLGQGKYFTANSTAGFAEAVQGAIRLAQLERKPAAPQWREVFRDDFNGEALGEHWTVLNSDSEAYIVENGKLTLIVTDPTEKGWLKVPNIFRLNTPLPKGDWRMTMRFSFKPQTFGERVFLGLTNKTLDKMAAANFELYTGNYATTYVNVRADKLGRKNIGFHKKLMELSDRVLTKRGKQFSDKIAAVELRLQKKGRRYISSVRLIRHGGEGKPLPARWHVLQELTSLRLPGDALSLFAGSFPNAAGKPSYDWYLPKNTENAIDIDWVSLEVPASGE